MRTTIGVLTVVGLMGLFSATVKAVDAVEPAQASMVCLREEGVSYIASTEFYRGTTLLLTNCAVYAGASTNSARQGLDGVSIEVKVGTAVSNVTYAGNMANTNGLWWTSFTIPTNWEAPNIQIKLTDSTAATNVYIYPWKLIHTKAGL